MSHNVEEEITNLKKQPGKNIIIWGGADFASNLINLKLVDELRIELNSTILGDGKSLFGNIKQRSRWQLIDSRPLKPGLIVLRYKM